MDLGLWIPGLGSRILSGFGRDFDMMFKLGLWGIVEGSWVLDLGFGVFLMVLLRIWDLGSGVL